jgi:hypothetical protein
MRGAAALFTARTFRPAHVRVFGVDRGSADVELRRSRLFAVIGLASDSDLP